MASAILQAQYTLTHYLLAWIGTQCIMWYKRDGSWKKNESEPSSRHAFWAVLNRGVALLGVEIVFVCVHDCCQILEAGYIISRGAQGQMGLEIMQFLNFLVLLSNLQQSSDCFGSCGCVSIVHDLGEEGADVCGCLDWERVVINLVEGMLGKISYNEQ